VTPARPSIEFTKAETRVTPVTVAARTRVVFKSKTEPVGMDGFPSARFNVRSVNTNPYITVARPATTSGNLIIGNMDLFVACRTTAISTMVAIDDNAAPAVADRARAGSSFMRAPIVAIVAALEANPEASPASGSPRLTPRIRTATYPAALTDISSATNFHIIRGLIALRGPKYRFGMSGSTTTTAAAKMSA
jgi:hypothetical protein